MILSACSGAPAPPDQQPKESARAFTEEDRRIARKLSVGTGSLTTASPEGRALLCVLGLDAISEQLMASGALSPEQRRAFIEARDIYRRRAAAGYSDAAKLAEAQRAAERDFPGSGDRARLAIACLRDMA